MKFLIDKTGVTDDRKVKNFTPEEFTKLWKAIKQFEGFKVGEIYDVHKVSEVKRDHTGICEFFIDPLGWITKQECLSLAKSGVVNLVEGSLFDTLTGHHRTRVLLYVTHVKLLKVTAIAGRKKIYIQSTCPSGLYDIVPPVKECFAPLCRCFTL